MKRSEARAQAEPSSGRPVRLRDRFASPPPAEADRDLPLLRNYEEMQLGWFWSTDGEGEIT
jgi:hypothetical protein